MELIKIKTPNGAIIAIDILNFEKAQIVEKGILEVIFKDSKDNFLIKGKDIELEVIFDELISQKNHYTKTYQYLEEKDLFYKKLVERLSVDLIQINEELIRDNALSSILSISNTAKEALDRLNNFDKLIISKQEDLDEISAKISKIKEELF